VEYLTLDTRAAMARYGKILRDLDLVAGIIEKWSDPSDTRWYAGKNSDIADTDRIALQLAAKRLYWHAREIVGDNRDSVILHSIGHALVRVAEAADVVVDWRPERIDEDIDKLAAHALYHGTQELPESYRPALNSARALITQLQVVRLW